MLLASYGSKTDTKRHDKGNCHGPGGHSAGVKCDCDKILWNKQCQNRYKDIKKIKSVDNDFENSIRSIATTRKKPTPQATASINV